MLNYWGGAEHHKKTRGIGILTGSVSPMIIFACRTATEYALAGGGTTPKNRPQPLRYIQYQKDALGNGIYSCAKYSIPTERPATIWPMML